MMKFEIMSQKLAEQTDGRNRCIISITDPGKSDVIFSYSWKDILRIKFDDLCPDECRLIGRKDLLNGAQLFNKKHAKSIFEFLAKNKDSDFVVHCKMGVSRSAAIALFLAEKFGSIENTPEYLSRNCRPNPYVIKILNEIYGELFNK